MSLLLLENARLLDPEGVAPPRAGLLVEDGRIAAWLESGAPRPTAARCVDLGGLSLAPGFIDLHHHGGLVLADAGGLAASIERSSASLVRHGTTAFLPTSVSWAREALAERVAGLARRLDAGGWSGAVPLGLHLEGPWIRADAAGAQPAGAIRPYDAAEGREVLGHAGGWLRMVTLAPEIPGARQLLQELSRRGVVASLGHSLAGAEAIEAGIDLGLRHVTHLFNAMGPFHHRERGTAGVALTDSRLSCDLICDGAHVHPSVVALAAREKGEQLLLITDRVELEGAAAAPSFGSGPLHSDGVALRLADGRLAASCLTLDRAVGNLSEFAGWTRAQAIAACTLAPARLLGIEAERGTLRPGARADLAVLGSRGEVVETWIAGERVYATAPPSPATG